MMNANGSTAGWPDKTSHSPTSSNLTSPLNWNQQHQHQQPFLQQNHYHQPPNNNNPTPAVSSTSSSNPPPLLNQSHSNVMFQHHAYASMLEKQPQEQLQQMQQPPQLLYTQQPVLTHSAPMAQNQFLSNNMASMLPPSFSWANPSLVSDPAAASLMFQSIEAQANATPSSANAPSFNQLNQQPSHPQFNNVPMHFPVPFGNTHPGRYPGQQAPQLVNFNDISNGLYPDNAQRSTGAPEMSLALPTAPNPSRQTPVNAPHSPVASATGSLPPSSTKRSSGSTSSKTPGKRGRGAGASAKDEVILMRNDPWYREWIPVLKARNLTYKIYNTGGMPLNWKSLWETVHANGGWEKISTGRQWRAIADQLGYPSNNTNIPSYLRKQYATYLFPLEEYRGMRSPSSTPVVTPKSRLSHAQPAVASLNVPPSSFRPPSTEFVQNQPLPLSAPMSQGYVDLSNVVRPGTPGGFGPLRPTFPLFKDQFPVPTVPVLPINPVVQQPDTSLQVPSFIPLVPAGFKLMGMCASDQTNTEDMDSSKLETDGLGNLALPENLDVSSDDANNPKTFPFSLKKSDLYEYKKYFPKMSSLDTSTQVAGMNMKALNRYVVESLRGGYETSLSEKWHHIAKSEPLRLMSELGILDIRALTCMVTSGLQYEVARALNLLLVVSTVSEIDLQLSSCPALVRGVAIVAISHVQEAMKLTEISGFSASTHDSVNGILEYLLPVDNSINEPQRMKLEYELEIALEAVLILRNWSFEHAKLFASLPRVIKALLDIVAHVLPRINSVAGISIPWWSHTSANSKTTPSPQLRPIGRSAYMIDILVHLVHHVMVIFANIVLDLEITKYPRVSVVEDQSATPSLHEVISRLLDLSLFWLIWSKLYVPSLRNVMATPTFPTAQNDSHEAGSSVRIGPTDIDNAEMLSLSVIAGLLPQIDPVQVMDLVPCNPVAATLLCTRIGHMAAHHSLLDMALIALRGTFSVPSIFVPFIQCHVTPVVEVILGLLSDLSQVAPDSCSRLLVTLDVIMPELAKADAHINKSFLDIHSPSILSSVSPVSMESPPIGNGPPRLTVPIGESILSPDLASPTSPTLPANGFLSISQLDEACLELDKFPSIIGSMDRPTFNSSRSLVPWDRISDLIYKILVNENISEPVRDGAVKLFAMAQEYRPSI